MAYSLAAQLSCCADEVTPGTFTLLAYTNEDEDVAVPSTWGDADPHLIDRGKVEQVRLRSFSTNVHSLEVSLALVNRLWISILRFVGRTYQDRSQLI